MTNLKRNLKGILTVLLSLAMVVAMSVSMLASAAETATETVVVQQKIEKGTVPSQTSYTYWLTPENAACPLPKELQSKTANSKGQYEVGTINGDSTDETALMMTFEIDKSEPGSYVYYLEKTPETPAGDTFTLEKWKFGFRVTTDEKTGKLVAFPEVCVGGESKLSDNDADGYPTKLTMINSIKGVKEEPDNKGDKGDQGDKGDKGDPGKNGSNGTNGKNGTDGRNGTNGTSTVKTITQTVGKAINTGDPNHILLWGGIALVSVGALIAILIVRRKKEKDNENS